MRTREHGFTLVESLMTVLLVAIAAAVTVPGMATGFRRYQLDAATREIAGQIRAARLRAVTANETMRVRFNCPAPGQLRVVQLVDSPAIDDAADRCSGAAYPFPDRDETVEPNHDGPVMALRGGIRLGEEVFDIEIAPTGRMTASEGTLPATIVVRDDHETRGVTVTAAGQVVGS